MSAPAIDHFGAPAGPARPVQLCDVRLPGQHTTTDILCRNGRIERVGPITDDIAEAIVVEGGGQLVLPAFVDVHSHADGRAWDPALSEPKRRQGIALEVVGNCGLGPAPTGDPDRAWFTMIGGVLLGCPETWSFPTFGEYLGQLQQANADRWPGMRSLLPYTAVRASVAGWRDDLDDGERLRVRRAIEDGLAAGAVGVSLGLVYPPSTAATLDELTYTLAPLANQPVVLATHIRSQANRWIEAIDEMLTLGRRLNSRLVISHLCVGGKRNQWKADWVLARLHEARREGLDVWFDQHPYSAGSTSLTQLLPGFAMRSAAKGVELAVDPQELRALLAVPSVTEGWENYLELIGADHIMIAGAEGAPELVGRTIAEIQAELDLDLAGTLVELMERTHGSAAIVVTELYDEATIARIASVPFGCFSTDGVHSALPHPRLHGTYPYAFHRFVQSGMMTEDEFVERSSRRPAQILNLGRSCAIEAGAEADLMVVDAATFDHAPDYLNPWAPVSGLRSLVLGGELQDLGNSNLAPSGSDRP